VGHCRDARGAANSVRKDASAVVKSWSRADGCGMA